MTKTALIILAEGFEEIEAICPIDILRRAGVDVTVAGLDGSTVMGAHGVAFTGDAALGDVCADSFDAVVLPGGMPGSQALADSSDVRQICQRHNESGAVVAAICAAPGLAFATFGLLDGKRATCYPGFETNFPTSVTYVPGEKVVVDGSLLTGSGPGAAFPFGLALAGMLVGDDVADQLAGAMQFA